MITLWVLTLLLAPFVEVFYNAVMGRKGTVVTLLEVYPLTLLLSTFLSLPTLLLAYLVNVYVVKNDLNLSVQKAVNIFIAAVGLMCTFLFIEGSIIAVLIPVYIITLVSSAIAIELFSKKN